MATLNIIVGSVYGNAENVAEEVQSYCEDQGIPTYHLDIQVVR